MTKAPHGIWAMAVLAGLSACASRPAPEAPTTPAVATPVQPSFRLTPTQFDALPGWAQSEAAPALAAFRRQCDAWARRTPSDPVGQGRHGGAISDWLPACRAGLTVGPGQERAFFEAYFTPQRVSGQGEARLTAYFEPIIEARRTPEGAFTEPFLSRPSDMVTVELSAFAEAYDSDTLRGAPRRLTGRLNGDRVQPYPERRAIQPTAGQAFAYAHPADVYNLQVQGSGRLRFPDGSQARAAFAAQNGYRWRSAIGALRDRGELSNGATWGNFKAWITQRGPVAGREALAADPSYVFFAEEPIADPAIGPRGAANVNLTPMGSLAVDPDYHPYGALLFVAASFDGAPFTRLLVAQDTGGAIRRGPERGDVFFGVGPEAGAAAERMNSPAQFWALSPRPAGAPVS